MTDRNIKILTLHELRELAPVGIEDCYCGVYFLWLRRQLVYVGQSVFVGRRVHSHSLLRNRDWTAATGLSVEWPFHLAYEAEYIRHYKPRLNRQYRLPSGEFAWMPEDEDPDTAEPKVAASHRASQPPTPPNGRPIRMLRLPAVLDRVGLSRTRVYELEAAGKFPARRKLSARAVAWIEYEIDDWLTGVVCDKEGRRTD